MIPRRVFPELFHGQAAPIRVGDTDRLSLRWQLHPDAGLPTNLFHVWAWAGSSLPVKGVATTVTNDAYGSRRVSFEGPAAGLQLSATVPVGSTLTIRAMTEADGSGRCVDAITVPGSATATTVVLWGSPIGSAVLVGGGTVTGAVIVPLQQLLDDPSWKLVETIGLPVDKSRFGGTGYPLDPQGVVGAELDPVDDAIRRLKGGETAGWPTVTDRGLPIDALRWPDPTEVVKTDLAPLLDALATMLKTAVEPATQATSFFDVKTRAPQSVHGVDAPQTWQDSASSDLAPLGVTLLAAATDPVAALALGFGTTVELPKSASLHRSAATNPKAPAPSIAYLVTVAHRVTVERMIVGIPFTLTFDGELATLLLKPQTGTLVAPTNLATGHRPPDRPGVVDGPWLDVARVGWAAVSIDRASETRVSAYAVARAVGADKPVPVLAERPSGGWLPFVPAVAGDADPATTVTFVESAVPEQFPGEPATMAYSVAPADVFGRWGPWATVDHDRIVVAPQVPTVRWVELVVRDGTTPTRAADAIVEVVWDWADRTPERIEVRVAIHADGTIAPDTGTVLGLGAPVTADLALVLTGLTEDQPPAGATLVADDTDEHLRTYRVVIPVTLAFATASRIRLTGRARASERIRPGTFSGWSPTATTMAASPVAPPAPFVPAAMTWGSVPDPRGVSRMTLAWTGTAPRWAVVHADETAIRREAGLPSADLETSPADRLPALRPLTTASIRRAFRRVATDLRSPGLPIELPRGSNLIHFYGVVPISDTGVEGALPADGNGFVAIAAPRIVTPAEPRLVVQDRGGVVSITVEVSEEDAPVDRIEVLRTRRPASAAIPEEMGPPFAVRVTATDGVRLDGIVRFTFDDPTPGPAWRPVFYRCRAIAASDPVNGVIGGASPITRAMTVVPTATTPPPLAGLVVDPPGVDPDHRLVTFTSLVPLLRTNRGAHRFAIQMVGADASVTTRRVEADRVVESATIPTATTSPDAVIRVDATGRTCTWVPHDVRAVIVEITDPTGQRTRSTWSEG